MSCHPLAPPLYTSVPSTPALFRSDTSSFISLQQTRLYGRGSLSHLASPTPLERHVLLPSPHPTRLRVVGWRNWPGCGPTCVFVARRLAGWRRGRCGPAPRRRCWSKRRQQPARWAGPTGRRRRTCRPLVCRCGSNFSNESEKARQG